MSSFNITGRRSLFGGAQDGVIREGGTCRYAIAAFENLKKTEIEMPSCVNKMYSFFHTNKIRFAVHYPIWLNDDHSTDYTFSFALFDSFGNLTTLIDIDESDLCQDDGDRSYIPPKVEYLIYGKSQIQELCNYLLLKKQNIGVDEIVENSLTLCRQSGFPFPRLSEPKLKESWRKLCGIPIQKSKTSTTGNDILRHFHQSIYAYRSGDTPSLLEAWKDDEILRKIIRNRILYSGVQTINGKPAISPNTVVLGLNQAKVAAKISLFRPSLARYLTQKYLSDKEIIFDAFNGFLGRALGVGSLGKKYRGGDINETTIKEVSEGCGFLGVDYQGILNDAWNCGIEDKFEKVDYSKCGMLTCSPYGVGKHEEERELSNGTKYKIFTGASTGAKESWNDSFTDNVYTYDWVERTLLLNPNIDRFVFVLDKPGQFQEFVREEIVTDTVFAMVYEYVVVIDRKDLRDEHFLHGGSLWEQEL